MTRTTKFELNVTTRGHLAQTGLAIAESVTDIRLKKLHDLHHLGFAGVMFKSRLVMC